MPVPGSCAPHTQAREARDSAAGGQHSPPLTEGTRAGTATGDAALPAQWLPPRTSTRTMVNKKLYLLNSCARSGHATSRKRSWVGEPVEDNCTRHFNSISAGRSFPNGGRFRRKPDPREVLCINPETGTPVRITCGVLPAHPSAREAAGSHAAHRTKGQTGTCRCPVCTQQARERAAAEQGLLHTLQDEVMHRPAPGKSYTAKDRHCDKELKAIAQLSSSSSSVWK